MQTGHGCAITGWASALPPTVVTNADIMTLFDTSDEWIVERTGIRQRRAADGQLSAPNRRPHPQGAWALPLSWPLRPGGLPSIWPA